MTPKVAILHVGGTIGMAPSSRGLVPQRGEVQAYLDALASLPGESLPSSELIALEPLMDSADMRPADWVRVANAIVEHDSEFDGFLVLHGTDTMVYTASAVSFLLEGLCKPVIFTGAQLPIGHVRSDGREHVTTGLLLAGTLPIPEVTVYFADRLLRGNRSQKVDANTFVAFDSGNLPPLARIGVEIDVQWHLVRPAAQGPCTARSLVHEPEVIAVRLFPGIGARTLSRIMAPPVSGVVLETYGAGTFPTADPTLLEVVRAAVDRGVVVVACTQVHAGRVQPTRYGTGAALADVGVVSGEDMTPEAALTKLWCLLASGMPPERVAMRMGEDVAGEITPRPPIRSDP